METTTKTAQSAPTAEIKSYYDKLANLEQNQQIYKEINSAYRKWLKNPKSLDENTILGASSKELIRTWTPRYSYEKSPIEPWRMSNNNAMIKNTKDRIAQLEAKHKQSEEVGGGSKEYEFPDGKVVVNYAEERVQLFYNEKPNSETIEMLKRNGFKWSYTNEAWQRMITNATFYDVQTITGVVIPRIA